MDDNDNNDSNFPPSSPLTQSTSVPPYENSILFHVRKIDDPIGFLPGRITLGINKRGVHFFGTNPREYLCSSVWRDIMEFAYANTAVFIKMKVASVLHSFHFGTKQGKEICDELRKQINDVMLRRASKKICSSRTKTEEQEILISELQSRLEEAEKKISDGENERKKLHNTILELKGNIRVCSRVRSSLPDDNTCSGRGIDLLREGADSGHEDV